jgi:AmiR/NasT family two-component response regulator
MKRLAMNEGEAYRRLRKMASNSNWRLAELAQKIVTSDEVYQELERL